MLIIIYDLELMRLTYGKINKGDNLVISYAHFLN